MREIKNWRDRLPAAVVTEIEDEIERFRRIKAYEEVSPRVRETLQYLREISTLATKLEGAMSWLRKQSPIGMAGIFEAAAADRIVFGTYEIAPTHPVLRSLAKYAGIAADQLEGRFSPLPGEGQGSGSSAGRLSDYRVVGFERGQKRQLQYFRSPKDQLGIGVLVAIYSNDAARSLFDGGTLPQHATFLEKVLADADGSAPASWTRLLRKLDDIKDLAVEVQEAKAAWSSITSLFEIDEDAFSR